MRDTTGRSPALSDRLLVGGAAAILLAAVTVWTWGAVAGLIFKGAVPRASLASLPLVLMRLPSHPGNPAAAWPPAARPGLPGPLGCYGALALLLAAAGATGRLAPRHLGRHWPARRSTGARMARRSDLRELRGRRRTWLGDGRRTWLGGRTWLGRRLTETASHRGAAGTRLALGRRGRHLLLAETRHAVVAFGPPQSGKSAGLAVPALLEWEGPAVASSIKTDLLSVTERRRRALGEVLVFDPFALSGTPGHSWSPLGRAATWDGALEAAARMASAGEVDGRGVEGGDFWAIAAEQRLAPLLFTAAVTAAGMDDVVRWAYGQGGRDLDDRLEELLRPGRSAGELRDARAAYDALRAFDAQADRTRSSIEATVQGMLRAYRFSSVIRSAAGCEITAERLLSSSATLYLIGDAKASKLLRPIFLALLGEIVDRAYELANAAGGSLPLPLLLCLDEAGNVAPLPNLAEIASTAPSHNIQLLTIFHDLVQARARYRNQAETVVNSHRARMLLPGVADLETLRLFSGLVGDEEARELTRTTGAGGTSRSTGVRRRPLVAPEALRQLPQGQALLLYGRLPPAQVRLRRWFEDRRLRQLVEGR